MTYTRWGKSSRPNITGTELVYSGRAGGSHYPHAGAANYLCMPSDPQYTLPHRPGVQDHMYVYGTEYQHPIQGSHDHNVPCAVCAVSTREMVLMIPAKTSCPTSWTRDTSCLKPLGMQDPCTHALTEVRSPFQVVMTMLTVFCSTTLRPAVLA